MTARSLRAIPRVPGRLLDVTIQPIVSILLFLYVFGSAIQVPHISSMPISRLSIISGQVMGQFCEQVLGMVIVVTFGLILGWTPHLTFWPGAGLVGLIILAVAVPLALRSNRTLAG